MQPHKRFISALFLLTLIFATAVGYATASPTDEEKWAYLAANMPFKRVAMHGAIDGITVSASQRRNLVPLFEKPTQYEFAAFRRWCRHQNSEMAVGRVIEIQVFNREKFRNVVLKTECLCASKWCRRY